MTSGGERGEERGGGGQARVLLAGMAPLTECWSPASVSPVLAQETGKEKSAAGPWRPPTGVGNGLFIYTREAEGPQEHSLSQARQNLQCVPSSSILPWLTLALLLMSPPAVTSG